jgi:hypothetical protein
LSLGDFVIRSLMAEAAATVGLDPNRLLFAGCFQILKCRLPECDGTTLVRLEAWYGGLLREIQAEGSEPRRNRINERYRGKSRCGTKRPLHNGRAGGFAADSCVPALRGWRRGACWQLTP